MSQVYHSKGEMMPAQEVDTLDIKAQQESAKLVNPRKTALAGKTTVVKRGVKAAFTSAFGGFTITFVLRHVRNKLMIKTHFASLTGVKGTIGIEKGPDQTDTLSFNEFESGL